MKKSLVLGFILSFIFPASLSFSDEKPAIEHRTFVDLVIAELDKTPQTDEAIVVFVEWISVLKEINGAYVTYRLSEHLERRFGRDSDFMLKMFLKDFDARKKPTFDLETLLKNKTYGEKIKNLIESQGYALRAQKSAPVESLPEFENAKKEVPESEVNEKLSLSRQGAIVVQFSYRFECDEDEITECQEELKAGKLPGERGLFNFLNNTTFSFAFDTYQQVFDAMMKKLAQDFGLKKPTQKRVTHKVGREAIEVQVKTIFDAADAPVQKELLDLDSESFASVIDKTLEEFEEEHDNDWIRIHIQFVEDASLQAKKEKLLTDKEIESLKLLQNAKGWEEEWLALNGLVSAPITPSLKGQLIRILESGTTDRIKQRVALILAKDQAVYTDEGTLALIDPIFKNVSNKEFQFLISSIPSVEKTFVLYLLKNKTPHARKLIELFMIQNAEDIDQIAEVLKTSWCSFRVSDCSYYNSSIRRGEDCTKFNCREHNCSIYGLKLEEFEQAASSENYRVYLTLREADHYCLQTLVARVFGKYGKQKDIVDILSLIDSEAPFVKEEAEKAIQAMRERK